MRVISYKKYTFETDLVLPYDVVAKHVQVSGRLPANFKSDREKKFVEVYRIVKMLKFSLQYGNCFLIVSDIFYLFRKNTSSMCDVRGRRAVTRYYFSTGTVGTLEKKYRYRSVGTFISQFLGGTLYFCKIFCNQKKS